MPGTVEIPLRECQVAQELWNSLLIDHDNTFDGCCRPRQRAVGSGTQFRHLTRITKRGFWEMPSRNPHQGLETLAH